MLAAAGVETQPEYPLDGVNLLPLFADPSWNPARDLCWRMKHREQRALIRGDWKYLVMDGNEYLFNLAARPARASEPRRARAAAAG